MNYLILGDVHAEYEPFRKALDYAEQNNLFVISVGDLIDNGSNGYEVFRDFYKLVKENKAALTWGNHEWKIYRWLIGNPVKLGGNNKLTVDQMNNNKDFIEVFMKTVEFCQHYIQINENMFVTHAGVNPEFWSRYPKTIKKDLDVFKYGQVDHSQMYHYRDEVYPNRVYDWVDCVPNDAILFVGHDPRPMTSKPDFDNFQTEPSIHLGKQGGRTVFLDCGAGKGGWLCGAVVNSVDNSISSFINFSK